MALVAVIALAGASTAAALSLLSASSAPLASLVPGLTAALRYDVPLTPDLEAGGRGMVQLPDLRGDRAGP